MLIRWAGIVAAATTIGAALIWLYRAAVIKPMENFILPLQKSVDKLYLIVEKMEKDAREGRQELKRDLIKTDVRVTEHEVRLVKLEQFKDDHQKRLYHSPKIIRSDLNE